MGVGWVDDRRLRVRRGRGHGAWRAPCVEILGSGMARQKGSRQTIVLIRWHQFHQARQPRARQCAALKACRENSCGEGQLLMPALAPPRFPRTSSHAGGHSWACGSSACAAASGGGRVGRGRMALNLQRTVAVHPAQASIQGPAHPRQPCRPSAIRATNARDGQAQGPRPHILHPNPTPPAARTPPKAASPMPQPVSKLSAKRPASARLLRSSSKPFSKRGPALQQLQRDIGTVR